MRFIVGDHVFLSVSPTRGVMRFERNGKLNPQYIAPFEILRAVGEMAYELALPLDFATVHPVFYVSLLKKCIGDPAVIVPIQSIDVQKSLSYKEIPFKILDSRLVD